MGFALYIKCPSCDKYGKHKVLKTNPTIYWKDDIQDVGVDPDSTIYRKRTKQCSSCKEEFNTIEIFEESLEMLITTLRNLNSANRTLMDQRNSFVKTFNHQILLSNSVSFYTMFCDVFGDAFSKENVAQIIRKLSDKELEKIVNIGFTSVKDMRGGHKFLIFDKYDVYHNEIREIGDRSSDESFTLAGCMRMMSHPERTRLFRGVWAKYKVVREEP
ncbi:MAG: hypothetical protein EXR07_19635 [Acetobacteraceae bacterium]|nr:hypothetical protein [Acetobacteraceae bacterium]